MDFTPPENLPYRPAKPFASTVADSPLTPEHLAELEKANLRSKKIRRAVTVAMSDAWISAFFAAGCLLSACFGIDGLILGVALSLVTVNSFRGAYALRRMDVKAPQLLAFNQIFLAISIIIYAAFQLWRLKYGKTSILSSLIGDESMAGLGDMGDQVEQIKQMVILACYAVYWSLIAGTILFQGLTAWYYATRITLLREYLEQTPAWVTDLQRRTTPH